MEQPVFLNATQMDSPVEGIDAVRLGATVLPENPFVGLRPFESKEAVLFFGRRDQTKDLLSILHASRFVAVVGSSGCGKSSLIRAGLIPNLQAGFVAGSVDRWNIITMKPGNSPLQNLATALLKSFQEKPQPGEVDALVSDISLYGVSAVTSFLDEQTKGVKTNFLLLVDQFEEIFRFAAYEEAEEKTDSGHNKLNRKMKETHREEAADLVSIMLDLVVQESIPVFVVMTMRSDFLGECDAFYGLPEAMNKSQYLVPRLTRQQRLACIENPVLLYGAAISERLTDRVLNDMEDERDQLPIMQHALMRTWEKWQIKKDGPLDLSHYNAAGTVAEALSRDAEDALAGLSPEEITIAERMFQALTTADAKGRRLRRPTHLSELAAITGSRETVLKLIDRFRDNNRCFLMLSEDRDPLVDISHESLIRQWGTLRKWVDDEVTSREMYLRLASDAVRHKAKEAPLWSDPALQLALNWWSRRNPTEAWGRRYHKEFKLTEAFLKDSEKKRDDDAQKAQQLQDEEAKRERENFEKAQRQAELEKEQAQELAAAQQRELQSKELLYKQRAKTIRRTRLLVVVLAVTLLGVGLTAAWALRAQAEAKKSEANAVKSAAEANEARKQVETQRNQLAQNEKDLVAANTSLLTERDKAEKARADAEKARDDAEKAKNEAEAEKAKVVLALQKADQTAAADKLRRKAANEQNAGELEDAQVTYLDAAKAYKQIDDKEGAAYTYSELGNMLAGQEDDASTVEPSRREDRERWDRFLESNWVDRVLLGPPVGEAYFNSIGMSKVHAKGLDYYIEAIKAYRQTGGDSGLNGVAAALERVGDVMASNEFDDDDESEEFANRHRAIATRDSFCMALENYQRADNSKRRIALLNKIGDHFQRPGEDSSEVDVKYSGTSADAEIGGCHGLGNDSATYFEESVKLYPNLLKKYPHESNKFKNAQQSFVDLLLKLGNLYYQRANAKKDAPNQTYLNLAIDRFNRAAEIFRAEGNVEKTVNTYRVIAEGFDEGDLKSKFYELAAAEYHRVGKPEAEATFLVAIGRKYFARARTLRTPEPERIQGYNKAIFYLNRAIKLYQQQGNREDSSGVYAALGAIYSNISKYDEALAAYQSALSNSQSINNTKLLLRDHYNLGRFLEIRGDKDEAKKSYEKVISLVVEPIDATTRNYKKNADNGLKRLRGELPPLNPPKPEPSPKAQPSPSPAASLLDVRPLGAPASTVKINVGPGQYHLAVAGGCVAMPRLLNHLALDLRCGYFASQPLRTHPLPRGGTDPVQVCLLTLR